MSKRIIIFGFVLPAIFLAGVLVLVYSIFGRAVKIDNYSDIDRPARIYPDYCSTVIPPDIAPLNFMVQENGSYYLARIYSDKGKALEVSGRSPKIMIPVGPWRELLNNNRGAQLRFDVFVRTDNHCWVRYQTITNKIAEEGIDGYLVYRRMHPPSPKPIRSRIGIFQRNLRNFDEKLVLDSQRYAAGCVNCHAFCGNRPGEALLGVRKKGFLTLFIERDKISKLQTKFGYTTWHPSGRLAAFSINNLPMFFHAARNEIYDTVDLNSDLSYFVVDSKAVKTSPEISRKERLETWPVWSADGRYLYFCSAPLLWTEQTKVPPKSYGKVKYDLVRISYDIESDKWGKAETVISANDTGLSIAMPRTSPDGRWLTFCMFDYGFFPTWQQCSDFYIVDLKAAQETGRYEYRRMGINSDKSESWHSWSSNSHWIVFSSKREHGAFTRSYLSYVDEKGEAYKPLIVPQKDPSFYSYSIEAFNTPEFAAWPMAATGKKLAGVVNSPADIPAKTPATMTTPKAKAPPSPQKDIFWHD